MPMAGARVGAPALVRIGAWWEHAFGEWTFGGMDVWTKDMVPFLATPSPFSWINLLNWFSQEWTSGDLAGQEGTNPGSILHLQRTKVSSVNLNSGQLVWNNIQTQVNINSGQLGLNNTPSIQN